MLQPAASPVSIRMRLHLWLLGRPNGATDEEMQVEFGLGPQTQTPRRGELVAMGFATDSGLRRSTRSGRSATVWRATGGPART